MKELEEEINKEICDENFLNYSKENFKTIRSLIEIDKNILRKKTTRGINPLSSIVLQSRDNEKYIVPEEAEEYYNELYEMIKFCLENGSSVTEYDESGNTLLHQAVLLGEEIEPVSKEERNQQSKFYNQDYVIKIVELLLNEKSDPNAQDAKGRTPMHRLSIREDSNYYVTRKLMKLLVKKGANINKIDNDGNTPLHYALKCLIEYEFFNEVNIVNFRWLTELGANFDIKNKKGETISDLLFGLSDIYRSDIIIAPCIALSGSLIDNFTKSCNENLKLKEEIKMLKNQLKNEDQEECKRQKITHEAVIFDNDMKVDQVSQSEEIISNVNSPKVQLSKQNHIS